MCESQRIEHLGSVFHTHPATVAGVPIDLGGIEYRLNLCRECAFQFKSPPIDASRLLACYEQASSSHWEDDPDPHERQFDVLRDLVQMHARGRRILDVGCFNGAILHYFGTDWNRFGVEPSVHAAGRADERGITILGRTVDDIPFDSDKFDVVLMIDVIEHLADPMCVLRRLRTLMCDTGIIVIGTGDTDAWSWRLQGSRYWYCSMPEHVSFFSRQTLSRIAAMLGMRSIDHLRLSHRRAGPFKRLRKNLKNLGFEGVRRCSGFGLPPVNRWIQNRPAPVWLTANDHMLHIMAADAPAAALHR